MFLRCPSSHTSPQAAQTYQSNPYSTTTSGTPRAQIGGDVFIPAQTDAQVIASPVRFNSDLNTKMEIAVKTFMGIINAETHEIVGRAKSVPTFLKEVVKHAQKHPLSQDQKSLVSSLITNTRRICLQHSLPVEQLDRYRFAP